MLLPNLSMCYGTKDCYVKLEVEKKRWDHMYSNYSWVTNTNIIIQFEIFTHAYSHDNHP
jgi:hypothetical protein